MTPREQAIFLAYGHGWLGIDILTSDGGIAHAKASHYGGSHLEVQGEGYWFSTSSKGIEIYRRDEHGQGDLSEILKWTTVSRYAKTIPTELRERMIAHRRAYQEHMGSYRRFIPSVEAVKERQSGAEETPIFDAESAAHEEVEAAYYLRKAELDVGYETLLAEALPLATEEAQDVEDLFAIAAGMGVEL